MRTARATTERQVLILCIKISKLDLNKEACVKGMCEMAENTCNFKAQVCYLRIRQPWERYLTYLSFSFLISKVRWSQLGCLYSCDCLRLGSIASDTFHVKKHEGRKVDQGKELNAISD